MPLVRLFIAIDLPEPDKEALSGLIKRVGRLPGKVSWSRPAQMHLTLQFLGDTPQGQVPDIAAAMQRAAGQVEAFEMGLEGVGAFRDFRRPRVVWVGVDDPTGRLVRLHEALELELAGLGFEPEGRDFHPHITLARIRVADRRADYAAAFADVRDFKTEPRLVEKVLLIRSDLAPAGPTYTVQAGAVLDATA